MHGCAPGQHHYSTALQYFTAVLHCTPHLSITTPPHPTPLPPFSSSPRPKMLMTHRPHDQEEGPHQGADPADDDEALDKLTEEQLAMATVEDAVPAERYSGTAIVSVRTQAHVRAQARAHNTGKGAAPRPRAHGRAGLGIWHSLAQRR